MRAKGVAPTAGSRDRTHWPETTVTAPTASRAPDQPSGTPPARRASGSPPSITR